MAVTGTPLYQMKAELFKSIGHPVRIRVLELLSERDHAVHELLEQIEVEQTGLSQHLAVLRRCGLVRQQRTAGQVIYSVTGDEVTDLLAAARSFLKARSAESEEALSRADEPAANQAGAAS